MKNKPVYILDATPVIYFAKIGKLELLSNVSHLVITAEVFRKTTSGDYPEVLIIREAVKSGVLRVYEAQEGSIVETLMSHKGVHRGEAETLAATKILGGLAVVDDAKARSLAKVYRIQVASGTLFLLFRLLASDIIDSMEAEDLLEKMVKSGLHLDPRTLLLAREKIRSKKLAQK